MSKVTTFNVTSIPPSPQKEVTATDVNTKFTAIQTATTTINNENVRSEGIDIRQLNPVSPIMKSGRYVYNKWDNGTTNTFTLGTGAGGDVQDNMPFQRAAVRLNYSIGTGTSRITYPDNAPLILNQGDLLRIHYGFVMHQVQLDGVSAVFPIDPAAPDREGIIFFPVYWDTPSTTPNNTGNMKTFPNRIVWWNNKNNSPTEIPQSDPPSAGGLPEERLLDDGICFHDLAAEEISVGQHTKPMRRLHGCLNYIHESATPLTIYQIQIATTPILRLVHYTGPGFDSRAFITNSLDQTPYYPLDIYMERGNLTAIVMRKGNKGTYW